VPIASTKIKPAVEERPFEGPRYVPNRNAGFSREGVEPANALPEVHPDVYILVSSSGYALAALP
jgi:hypothetical protein